MGLGPCLFSRYRHYFPSRGKSSFAPFGAGAGAVVIPSSTRPVCVDVDAALAGSLVLPLFQIATPGADRAVRQPQPPTPTPCCMFDSHLVVPLCFCFSVSPFLCFSFSRRGPRNATASPSRPSRTSTASRAPPRGPPSLPCSRRQGRGGRALRAPRHPPTTPPAARFLALPPRRRRRGRDRNRPGGGARACPLCPRHRRPAAKMPQALPSRRPPGKPTGAASSASVL